MTDYQNIYIQCIQEAWNESKTRNSAYSLRALARDLDVSPTSLSLILNKKRPLTIDSAIKWATVLKLSAEKKQLFLESVTRDSEQRLNPNNRKLNQLEEKIQYMQLTLDQFSLISDWYHLAILNLVSLKSFEHNQKWICGQLGITKVQCAEAIERLVRLDLLEIKDKKFIRTATNINTPSNIPSEAIKNFHRQNIQRAISSIDDTEVDERDISSIMMPIDKNKLAEAKKMITNFRRELSIFLKEEQGDQVYSLNIQLFPQNVEKRKKA